MPIQITTAYRVGELVFPTIQEAQQSELSTILFSDKPLTEGEKGLVESIVAHTDEVVAILTCEPKVRAPRKPRSDIGKKRKLKQSPRQQEAV
jgi:hypothetical protein